MPTILKETVVPMAIHSFKSERRQAARFIHVARKRDEAANCEAARRAKNIADAKIRDEKIKKRASEKAAQKKASAA